MNNKRLLISIVLHQFPDQSFLLECYTKDEKRRFICGTQCTKSGWKNTDPGLIAVLGYDSNPLKMDRLKSTIL